MAKRKGRVKLSAEVLEYFKEQGRKGGLMGGARAWEKLSPEERSARAKRAVDAREEKRTQKRARIDP